MNRQGASKQASKRVSGDLFIGSFTHLLARWLTRSLAIRSR
jgi:hypothetical protein